MASPPPVARTIAGTPDKLACGGDLARHSAAVRRARRRPAGAGPGGGFDVYAGLPLAVALRSAGTDVYLADRSFTALEPFDADAWLAPADPGTAAAGGVPGPRQAAGLRRARTRRRRYRQPHARRRGRTRYPRRGH